MANNAIHLADSLDTRLIDWQDGGLKSDIGVRRLRDSANKAVVLLPSHSLLKADVKRAVDLPIIIKESSKHPTIITTAEAPLGNTNASQTSSDNAKTAALKDKLPVSVKNPLRGTTPASSPTSNNSEEGVTITSDKSTTSNVGVLDSLLGRKKTGNSPVLKSQPAPTVVSLTVSGNASTPASTVDKKVGKEKIRQEMDEHIKSIKDTLNEFI
jgi:hypothetical protein